MSKGTKSRKSTQAPAQVTPAAPKVDPGFLIQRDLFALYHALEKAETQIQAAGLVMEKPEDDLQALPFELCVAAGYICSAVAADLDAARVRIMEIIDEVKAVIGKTN